MIDDLPPPDLTGRLMQGGGLLLSRVAGSPLAVSLVTVDQPVISLIT